MVKRCAVYTRKSTEDGLDQSFNSLDAQREACRAYVMSQKSEGWRLVPDAFDDGGYSGGSLHRPALQRLLDAIDQGAVDIIVVYKIDRLTRSLNDLSKLVEHLDAAGVTFVSVTQHFNTMTSMGRLTLNMLLSFAQFEREVTAERIRDKIAASRAKGLWTGGPVPLGYDAVDRALVVNPAEAETVRWLFNAYRTASGVPEVVDAAAKRGLTSKTRRGRGGRTSGGGPLGRGHIAAILNNPIYAGLVRGKERLHRGRHEAIISRDLWDAVQAKLASRNRRADAGRVAPSPLAGRLFDAADRPMTSSHTTKNGVRYRYYVSRRPTDSADVDAWRLSAPALESAAAQRIATFLEDPNALTDTLYSGDDAMSGIEVVIDHARNLAERIRSPVDQPALLDRLVTHIALSTDKMRISLDRAALRADLGLPVTSDDEPISLTAGFALRRRGVEHAILLNGAPVSRAPDPNTLHLFADARAWAKAIETGTSVKTLSTDYGVDSAEISRAIPLAYLAPRLVRDLVQGRLSIRISHDHLKRAGTPPLDWGAQAAWLHAFEAETPRIGGRTPNGYGA